MPLAPYQQAADELGSNLLGGAGEEGLREVLGERGGYGSGFVWKCRMLLTGQGRWARSRRLLFFQAMSEEQLKAVETEATAQGEENVVEEISEEDLEGVAGGCSNNLKQMGLG